MNSIDPLQLQRLVDGELGVEQWQSMLTAAEADPDQWRVIANAMIEDRLWQRTVQQSIDARPDLSERSSLDELPKPTGRIDRSTSYRSNFQWGWLAIATGLLLAFGTGYSLPFWINTGRSTDGLMENTTPGNFVPRHQDQVAQAPQPPAAPSNESQITPAVFQPDYHLELPEDNELLSAEDVGPISPVPLYIVASPDQLRQFQQTQSAHTRITPKLARQLKAAGYHVQQDIEFISGQMNDDKTFIVPVRTIRFLASQ